jgi:tetratricopeptide (TPR) repeat protein
VSDPSGARLRYEAAHYMQLGLHAQAVERLQRVLAGDPDDAGAHADLSVCLSVQKRARPALYEAELAVGLDPDLPAAHHALGFAALANRRYDQAEEHLVRAIALEPEDADRHVKLAYYYSLFEQRKHCRELIAKALALAPDFVDALVADGVFALDRGDAAHACSRAQQVLRMAPGTLAAIVLMGRALLRRGDAAAAREHALWALQEDGDHNGANNLMSAIKARDSLWIGWIWRYFTWLNERARSGELLVLSGGYVIYRLLSQVLSDVGRPDIIESVTAAWIALLICTVFGRAVYCSVGRRDRDEVQLKDF